VSCWSSWLRWWRACIRRGLLRGFGLLMRCGPSEMKAALRRMSAREQGPAIDGNRRSLGPPRRTGGQPLPKPTKSAWAGELHLGAVPGVLGGGYLMAEEESRDMSERAAEYERQAREVIVESHEGLIPEREADREAEELAHLSEVARSLGRRARY